MNSLQSLVRIVRCAKLHHVSICLSHNIVGPYLSITKNTSLSLLNSKGCIQMLPLKSDIGTSVATDDVPPAPPLTKRTANELVMRLNEDERRILLSSIQQFESDIVKAEYKGQLAAFRWRSKFGRPSKVPRLGDVDPTGSYCPMPEDWLLRKYAETVPKPTKKQLVGVTVHNAIPFVGFGFLDNFFMIICGDSIEMTLGTMVTISTMAAAALGNTFSDVLGIGSAWYVERFAAMVGVRPPQLSPIQLDMRSSTIAANFGRVIGVTIGCLLGMLPLLFMNKKASKPSEPVAQPSMV